MNFLRSVFSEKFSNETSFCLLLISVFCLIWNCPLSKTNHSEPLGIFESGSKMTKLSEIGAGPDKAVQVGETPMQWQHSNLLTADNMRAGNSQGGQCVEPGRYWIYSETVMDDTNKWKKFKLLSYNVLSQSLLEEHPFLYKENNKTALEWNFRRQLLFAEIRNLDADILCLQEVERDHWRIFETELKYFGYRGIYKKRSHKRVDGVAIFYKTKTFTLQEYTSVEFFQPSAPVLNRDNVALVAKLTYNAVPRQSIVVATTHLLFNMNRHDVKLAQTQLLLAEVERYAYAGVGGFNRWQVNGPVLNTTLLPYWLQVTDSCQHLGIQHLREHGVRDRTKEILHLKIRNSDFCHALKHRRENEWDVESSKLLQSLKPQPSSSQPTGLNGEEAGMEREFPSDRFQTGVLTHPFNLQSAYTDFDNEITTFQDSSWVTVDYIFYSTPKDELEGELALLATYKLPTVDEATRLGRIPNFGSPSDHYPLLVMFGLDSEGKKQHT